MIAIHPGEYIQEAYMEPLELSRTDLAQRLNVSTSTVSRILSGKAEVTPEMAVRLEYVLGRSAESWLAMQADYSIHAARTQVDRASLKAVPA
jgi:addiction module HigA family antidote